MRKSKILRIVLYIIGAFFVLTGGVLGWAYQYRDPLFKRIIAKLNQHINGQLTAENFHFTPFADGIGFSFTLFNVHLRDTAYAKHGRELLFLERLSIQVDAKELLQRKLQIRSVGLKNGKIVVFRDSTGYSNLSVFQSQRHPNTSTDSSFKHNFLGKLREICVAHVEFSLQDSTRHKSIHFTVQDVTNYVHLQDTAWNLHLKGGVHFRQLAFNTKRGAFLSNKPTELDMRMTFIPPKKLLLIEPSQVHVSQDLFAVKGKFDFAGQGRIKLDIRTDTIAALRALSIIPPLLAQKIAQFNIVPVVKAHVRLDAPLKGGHTPRVDIDFQTKTFKYQSPVGPMSEIIALASFTNQLDTTLPTSNQNTRITAREVTGMLYETIPMNTFFTITNLDEPWVVMEGNFKANLANCNSLFDEKHFRLKGGKTIVSYCYKGKMNPIFNPKTKRLNGRLEGHAKIENGAFNAVRQSANFSRINSSIRFTEQTLSIGFLHLNHQRNQVRISGKVTGLLPYAFNSSGKVFGDIAVYTPDLGLDWISNYPSSIKQKSTKRFTDLVDEILAQLELKAILVADRVRYRKFQAEHVRGSVYLSEQRVKCENVKMKAFGGTFQVSGTIEQFDRPLHHLQAKGEVNNADVQKVFYAFDNFGQSTISDHNLSGTLSTNFSYSSELRKDFSIVPSTMSGRLGLTLLNGQLNHFEPLKRVQRLLFKRRNFDNVRFENLQNQFVLQGQELSMNHMKVASSVLTFFVGGTYSFRDKTDVLVQIPLSNLKRNPNEAELQDLSGRNLLIRAIDEKGEIKLKYQIEGRKKEKSAADKDSLSFN